MYMVDSLSAKSCSLAVFSEQAVMIGFLKVQILYSVHREHRHNNRNYKNIWLKSSAFFLGFLLPRIYRPQAISLGWF